MNSASLWSAVTCHRFAVLNRPTNYKAPTSRRSPKTAATLLLLAVATLSADADIVVTKSITHTGEVLRVGADGVQIKVAIGELTIPRADILSVNVQKPASFDGAVATAKAAKFQEAVTGLKPLVERYAGLTSPWAQEAMLRLGDAYVGLKDYAAAKRTFDSFKALYPTSPLAAGIDVKYARVLTEQKDYAKAMDALNSFLDPMFKKDFLTDEQETAVAEALVLLGDCQDGTNKRQDALDSYLKVVTLFDFDADRAAEAKYKAAKIFEALNNWKRAKESYDELLKEAPSLAFAEDAKRRLAEITKAHPE